MHGDLCNKMNVNSYPTLNLYRDGKKEDSFKGDRTLERLGDWLRKWRDEDDGDDSKALAGNPTSTSKAKENPNPSGEVLKLTSDTFATFLESSTSPVFVKFFAPWCGHCKKLAPTWTALAKHLQNRLTIAEVNCEEEKAICEREKVPGYPALMFYLPGGEGKTEYTGGRKVEKLLEWAHRASAEPTKAIQAGDLEKHLKEENVLYVLLHGSNSVLTHLKPLFAPLLGAPWVYTILTPPPSIYSQYSLPSQARTSPFVLLSFKDNLTQPTSTYIHPSSSSHSSTSIKPLSSEEHDKIHQWLIANRLPGSLELTQESWQSVMNAPQAPLVVLAAAEGENEKKMVTERMAELATKWRLKTAGTGKVFWDVASGWQPISGVNPWKKKDEAEHDQTSKKESKKERLEMYGREVVFAFMDLDRWKDWLKSMYGIASVDKDGLDSVPVVVVDHLALTYYPLAPAASASHSLNAVNDDYSNMVRINLASSVSVFAAIEGAASGKLKKVHSENIVERIVRYLNGLLTSIEKGVASHPFRTVFMLFGMVALVIMVLRRLFREDQSYAATRREWEKDKGRMD